MARGPRKVAGPPRERKPGRARFSAEPPGHGPRPGGHDLRPGGAGWSHVRVPADLPTRRPGLATLGLTAVTAAWGSTFFMVKDVTTRVPVADFLALRFWLAGIALWLLAPRSIGRLSPIARRRGIALGVVYGTAQLLQTWGLERTSASISGFVTGMYVVITPLLAAVLLRQRIRPAIWLAV